MDALARSLKDSPEIFPFALDLVRDAASFARLPAEALEAASFLDERALGPGARLEAHAWPQVEAAVAAADLKEDCGFIFHIGHVGSTLISRLMGASPKVLALREPLALRTLAEAHAGLDAPESLLAPDGFERRCSAMLKLWSRRFAPGQRPIIKATSFCAGLAEDLLGRAFAPKALLMVAPPEPHLAALLGGPNNRIDIRAMAPGRLKRLHRRLGEIPWRLSSMSLGEMAAMGWASEMSALAAAAARHPERAVWLDFERFLLRPQRRLADAFAAFGIEGEDAEIAAILASPVMGRYAKAPEHAYGPAVRARVQDQARREAGEEIRRGMAWLDAAAARFPAIASALAAAEAQ